MTTIRLRSGTTTVEVDARAGGRVASLLADGHELLVTGTTADHPMMWGIFPMAPWVGRLRGGRFLLDGEVHEVPDTWREGPGRHALHGLVFDRAWTVQPDQDRRDSVHLSCPLPWAIGGDAAQRITARDDGLDATLSVRAGERAILAEVGWHPWFRRPLTVTLRPRRRWIRDADGLPTGATVGPTEDTASGPWDDTFELEPPAVVELVRDGPGPRIVTLTSDASHWVWFDALDHGVAVEPQSGPPDAFHLAPRRLEPGEEIQRTLRIRWQSA